MQIIPSFSHPCVISGEYYYTCVYHSMTKCFYLMNLKAILLQYSVTTLYSCSVVITNTQSSIIKREVIEYMTFDLFPIQWLFCCNSNQANSKVRHYNYLSLFVVYYSGLQADGGWFSLNWMTALTERHQWPYGSIIISPCGHLVVWSSLTHTLTHPPLFWSSMHAHSLTQTHRNTVINVWAHIHEQEQKHMLAQ